MVDTNWATVDLLWEKHLTDVGIWVWCSPVLQILLSKISYIVGELYIDNWRGMIAKYWEILYTGTFRESDRYFFFRYVPRGYGYVPPLRAVPVPVTPRVPRNKRADNA